MEFCQSNTNLFLLSHETVNAMSVSRRITSMAICPQVGAWTTFIPISKFPETMRLDDLGQPLPCTNITNIYMRLSCYVCAAEAPELDIAFRVKSSAFRQAPPVIKAMGSSI